MCNNEYTNEELMFRDWVDADGATEEQLRTSIAAHGMSVVELRRAGADQPWGTCASRRSTAASRPGPRWRSPVPAAGAKSLRTSADPQGRTPVGTFRELRRRHHPVGHGPVGRGELQRVLLLPRDEGGQSDRYSVYGSSGRGWERVDPAFGAQTEPNEAHRFGWIVEVDPSDPTSTPRKHTAMGRMKHEGATVSSRRDGRAVAYMGDDERFEYLYKFVSKRAYREGDRKHNLRLLEDGDLYVRGVRGRRDRGRALRRPRPAGSP